MTDRQSQDLGAISGSRASHEAASCTASSPSGFDPERIAEVVALVEPSLLAPIVKKAADEFYCTVMETAEDYLRDNLDWNLKSHLSMLERENLRLRTELSEVDRIVGPPWCTPVERILRLKEMDRAAADLIALRYAVQFDPKRAKALAAGTQRAETRETAAQSEGCQSGPTGQRPTSIVEGN